MPDKINLTDPDKFDGFMKWFFIITTQARLSLFDFIFIYIAIMVWRMTNDILSTIITIVAGAIISIIFSSISEVHLKSKGISLE